MQKLLLSRLIIPIFLVGGLVNVVHAQAILGDAPQAPKDLSGLPGKGPHPNLVSGGFSVDTSSREQVREFYNAVYSSSTGVPINSTAVTDSCYPGTNSPAFADATLRRINWFRAMAGIPAAVTFDATESTKDQAAALMMSEHGALQHTGVWTGWDCFSSNGTNASANSNLALGYDGTDAITAYILDNGTNNYEVGHRRWILYPQTQIMATGDVPPENTNQPANATWVFDANIFGPRPATRNPYVAWPPAGYVPYRVVFPRWSFALSNADLSAATVIMTSNGIAMPVGQEVNLNGFGENTLVWYPATLDNNNGTVFPFGGTDTVYAITINNVATTAGTKSFSYNVTLFDPAVPGPDYSALVISGPSQVVAGVGTNYSCTTDPNPNTTGYQWLVQSLANGNLVDNATNGLTNFTFSPIPPSYPVTTNPPVGSGKCFHLMHTTSSFVPQLLQLNEVLYPSSATALSFKSLLGYAFPNEVARVQASVNNGATWQDLFTEPGFNGQETSFTAHTLSLASYAGHSTLLRFNFDFSSGSIYTSAPSLGWYLENIIVTNCLQLTSQVTNSTSSTNFVFAPAQTGNYFIQAAGVVFNDFSTDFGVVTPVAAVAGPTIITLKSLTITGSQVTIKFSLSGTASSFHLLQANQPGSAWATNGTAALATNVLGSAYQFTTTNGTTTRFYRIVTP